jgi:hypothetical protein
MTNRTVDVLRTLPPRPLRPDERELVDAWLAAAGDVVSAYVSERRSDDPALYRRIVIFEDLRLGPSYLIHTPTFVDAWITLDVRQASAAQSFASLREALNSVRPVLLERWCSSVKAGSDEPEYVSRPRTISAEEQRILDRWLTVAPHGVSAYISQRNTDDPAMNNRIIVVGRGKRQPLYSVHSHIGTDIWIVTSLVEDMEVGSFATLRAALNFISGHQQN